MIVVDDDAGIRTVVRQALQRAGHMVRTSDSAAGMWKLIEEGVGDVLVTDVLLPDANGLDMIPLVTARRPELPVIVMSAQNTLKTAITAAETGRSTWRKSRLQSRKISPVFCTVKSIRFRLPNVPAIPNAMRSAMEGPRA